MSKKTLPQRRDLRTSPTGPKQQPAPVHHLGSSSHVTATAIEPNLSHQNEGSVPCATREQIAIRAFQLWEDHGRPAGTDRDDWFEAEKLLRSEAR